MEANAKRTKTAEVLQTNILLQKKQNNGAICRFCDSISKFGLKRNMLHNPYLVRKCHEFSNSLKKDRVWLVTVICDDKTKPNYLPVAKIATHVASRERIFANFIFFSQL